MRRSLDAAVRQTGVTQTFPMTTVPAEPIRRLPVAEGVRPARRVSPTVVIGQAGLFRRHRVHRAARRQRSGRRTERGPAVDPSRGRLERSMTLRPPGEHRRICQMPGAAGCQGLPSVDRYRRNQQHWRLGPRLGLSVSRRSTGCSRPCETSHSLWDQRQDSADVPVLVQELPKSCPAAELAAVMRLVSACSGGSLVPKTATPEIPSTLTAT